MRGAPSQAELLRKYGLKLNKRLGQHFLTDRRVLERIADAVQELAPQRVVELGPGAGALTFVLLARGIAVHALELDSRMIGLLTAESVGLPLVVEHADLAQEDYVRHADGSALVFAGNLPYQVTSPVLFGLLPALGCPGVRGAVLMMQSEVATRCAAQPGGRDYGVLSVLLQARLSIQRLFLVRPGAFLPPPRVDSAVVRLTRRSDPIELGEDGVALVKRLFRERRKQVGGLLQRLHPDGLTWLSACGIDPKARPEQLSIDDFARLARRAASA
jgi:16S rRNA (adenine1518-N6/adenine1519-N6)-dimethyltransferase